MPGWWVRQRGLEPTSAHDHLTGRYAQTAWDGDVVLPPYAAAWLTRR